VKKTSATDKFQADADFAGRLRALRQTRRERKIKGQDRVARGRLSRSERDEILAKTGGRCHFCGDFIKGDKWQADHLSAHSRGGSDATDNYLPAHSSCNRYRWVYGGDEFLGILRLGVWLRTQIDTETKVGWDAAKAFRKYDCVRASRRKKRDTKPRAMATDAR
jgi:5-methylcytosine-specific restriction endonuclease McrA